MRLSLRCAHPPSENIQNKAQTTLTKSVHNHQVNVQKWVSKNLTTLYTTFTWMFRIGIVLKQILQTFTPSQTLKTKQIFRDANLKPWESGLLTKPHECAGCCCIKLIIEKYRLTKFQFKKPNINTLEKRKKTLYLLQKRKLTQDYTQFSTPRFPKNHRPRWLFRLQVARCMRILLSSSSPLFSSISVCVQNMCAMASILVLRGIFQVNIPRFGNVLFSGYLLLCIGKPK